MEKTEFLVIGSEHNLRSYCPDLTLNVDTTEIKPVSSVRNLGVFMDSDGSMASQVGGLCRTLNYQLRNIARIRKYLDQDSCHHIVRSFILSALTTGIRYLLAVQLRNIRNSSAFKTEQRA